MVLVAYFNYLPEEITLEILSRVPTEYVLDCKLVCRNWGNLVRRPSFSKMHLHQLNHHDSGKMGFIALTSLDEENENYQYFEYDENHESTPIERIRKIRISPPYGTDTSFLGSCNGLICLARYLYDGEKTYICNPITREYVILPEIKENRKIRGVSGFGYISSTDEYKVVRIVFENGTEFDGEVYIYTLGSGLGWRNLGKFSYGTKAYLEEGIFVGGVVYWLDYQLEMISTFNLAEEKFCERLSPPWPLDEDDYNYHLEVFDGCLCFAIMVLINGAERWDMWLLKKKDDNHGLKEREGHQSLGWNEMFCADDNGLFAVTKGHGVLTLNGNHINICDLQASTTKRIVDFKEHFLEVFPHKNTLISLKELGEEDTKMMESDKLE